MLREEFGVESDVWSVTSFNELKRDADDVDRHNRLHPDDARTAHVTDALKGHEGPVVAATDYVRLFPDQIRAAVRQSAYSRYRICHETGIDQGAMSHFLAGHRGLSLDSIDRLGEFLALHIVGTSEKGP